MAIEDAKGKNFVYAGRRTGADRKPYVLIHILEDDGTIVKPGNTYDPKPFRSSMIVGGIYTGAKFDGGTAFGLKGARFAGNWTADPTQVAAWRALHDEHEKEVAGIKAEKNYNDPVREALLPLRRTLHDLRKRGMHHEAYAFTQMVFAEMQRTLRKDETE